MYAKGISVINRYLDLKINLEENKFILHQMGVILILIKTQTTYDCGQIK